MNVANQLVRNLRVVQIFPYSHQISLECNEYAYCFYNWENDWRESGEIGKFEQMILEKSN